MTLKNLKLPASFKTFEKALFAKYFEKKCQTTTFKMFNRISKALIMRFLPTNKSPHKIPRMSSTAKFNPREN